MGIQAHRERAREFHRRKKMCCPDFPSDWHLVPGASRGLPSAGERSRRMKRYPRPSTIRAVGASLATLACLGAPAAIASAADRVQPVEVTNTPLAVGGTVAATQSGPWSVGLSGTPSVTI